MLKLSFFDVKKTTLFKSAKATSNLNKYSNM